MAEDQDNVVLRLLREVRAKQDEDSKRLARVERTLDEIREGVVAAMGVAGYASAATESHGEVMDDMREKIASIEHRLSALESRQ